MQKKPPKQPSLSLIHLPAAFQFKPDTRKESLEHNHCYNTEATVGNILYLAGCLNE